VGDSELKALLPGLKASKGLRFLGFDRNTFGESSARDFLAAVAESQLVAVQAGDCRLPEGYLAKLNAHTLKRQQMVLKAGRLGMLACDIPCRIC
jgi:hypothetical protein